MEIRRLLSPVALKLLLRRIVAPVNNVLVFLFRTNNYGEHTITSWNCPEPHPRKSTARVSKVRIHTRHVQQNEACTKFIFTAAKYRRSSKKRRTLMPSKMNPRRKWAYLNCRIWFS